VFNEPPAVASAISLTKYTYEKPPFIYITK
jgi:hypothetical protein